MTVADVGDVPLSKIYDLGDSHDEIAAFIRALVEHGARCSEIHG